MSYKVYMIHKLMELIKKLFKLNQVML